MPAPALANWLLPIEEARAAGAAGVILTGNTSDRVLLPGSPPDACFLRFALARYLTDRKLATGYYAPGIGFEVMVPPGGDQTRVGEAFPGVPRGSSDPQIALAAVGRLLRKSDPKIALILDYAEHLAPSGSAGALGLAPGQTSSLELIHSWSLDDAIRGTGNFVVLISHEEGVHPLLLEGSGYRAVRIDLPGEKDRSSFLSVLESARTRGGQLAALEPGLTAREFSRHAAGLRLTDLEGLLRVGAVRNRPVGREDLREAKQETIRQLSRGVVEVIEPGYGFEQVAGAGHAKAFFNLIRPQWQDVAGSCPQAVLLAGVPGCGKSHIVKAIAHEFKAPLVVMRNVRDPYVGQSERNLERVFWITDNLAPCILWTDELDQAVGQRGTGPSGDSGTSERMLGRLFEYFGSMDKRGRILWIGTSNRPDILDPALLDRFQVVIPWLHPSEQERAELLGLLAKQVGRTLDSQVDVKALARLPSLEVLTVRSLQEIVVAGGIRADQRIGRVGSVIEAGDLLEAIADYKPPYDPVEHEFLALKALQMTTFHSLLPWSVAGGDPVVPGYLRGMIDGASGHLDHHLLGERIQELEELRLARRVRR